MKKVINLLLIAIIFSFFFITIDYYLSEKNIKEINLNRININQTLKIKSLNLPILKSDTEHVIEYNSSFSEEINKNKKRNFWNLFDSR